MNLIQHTNDFINGTNAGIMDLLSNLEDKTELYNTFKDIFDEITMGATNLLMVKSEDDGMFYPAMDEEPLDLQTTKAVRAMNMFTNEIRDYYHLLLLFIPDDKLSLENLEAKNTMKAYIGSEYTNIEFVFTRDQYDKFLDTLKLKSTDHLVASLGMLDLEDPESLGHEVLNEYLTSNEITHENATMEELVSNYNENRKAFILQFERDLELAAKKADNITTIKSYVGTEVFYIAPNLVVRSAFDSSKMLVEEVTIRSADVYTRKLINLLADILKLTYDDVEAMISAKLEILRKKEEARRLEEDYKQQHVKPSEAHVEHVHGEHCGCGHEEKSE